MFLDVASLPFSRGGWASGALFSLHFTELGGQPPYDLAEASDSRKPDPQGVVPSPDVAAAASARQELVRVGFATPKWTQLAAGMRPDVPQMEDLQLSIPSDGWQQAAKGAVQTHTPRGDVRQTKVGSLGRPIQLFSNQCVVPVRSVPVSGVATPPSLASPSFLLTQLSVWPCTRRPWPPRAACAEAGVLGRQGYALETAAAEICCEAGARVGTNIMVRDMDLLPLGGGQLAIDSTMVLAVRRFATTSEFVKTERL